MVRVGDTVQILYMLDEPSYVGRIGKVTEIDDIGQIHGSWGGCALIPGIDKFRIIEALK